MRMRDEQGAMMVFLAITMIVILALAGLVIDGGRAYADHREVQNSADVAALAGASALNGILFNSAGQEKKVYDAVAASITANGTNGAFDCNLIDEDRNDLGACPTTNTGAGLPATATGVSVRARDTQAGSFIKVINIASFSASGLAKAQIQALRGGAFPLMVCGLDVTAGGLNPPGTPSLLVADNTQNPPWAINSAAIGWEYLVHNEHVPDCGNQSSSFKGLTKDAPFDVPGWWDTDTGTKAGPTRQVLAGGGEVCAGELTVGCKLIIPICSQSNGKTGSQFEMYCVRTGVFEITEAGSNTHRAIFRGGSGVLTDGRGGGRPVANEGRVIKLSE
jgi:putative Flp pilus-assembly TadE/G-like protein